MYKRVLLKLSGEALAAGTGFGIDAVFIHQVAAEIATIHALGCEIGRASCRERVLTDV